MKITLEYGWFWECLECGADNFERGDEAKLPEKQRIEHGLSGEDADELITAPSRVRCKSCGFSADTDLPEDAIQGDEIDG